MVLGQDAMRESIQSDPKNKNVKEFTLTGPKPKPKLRRRDKFELEYETIALPQLKCVSDEVVVN